MLEVSIIHDCDIDWQEWGYPWNIHSFSWRHGNYVDPAKLGLGPCLLQDTGEPAILNIGLRRKLERGTAFFLSYFEHGNCKWFRKGGPLTGSFPDFRWDGRSVAGIAIGNNLKDLPKGYDERAKNLDSVLNLYTDYCNGEVYRYSIKHDDEYVEGCAGYTGHDYLSLMAEDMADSLRGREWRVTESPFHVNPAEATEELQAVFKKQAEGNDGS